MAYSKQRAHGVKLHVLPIRKGWITQSAQLGGRPAVLIYRKGRLRRAYTLLKRGRGRDLTSAELARVPGAYKWSTFTHDYAVIGQVRGDQFEALAISTIKGKQLISCNAFTGTLFDTPETRHFRRQQAALLSNRPTPPRKAGAITVISSLYRKRLLIQWYNRKTGILLFTLKLSVTDVSVLRRAQPVLDTRASKG